MLRHRYGVVKMHSLLHEILQHAGVDEFSKGVELEKKEVELAGKMKEIGRLSVGAFARGVDVEIDDPAGISPAKHLS